MELFTTELKQGIPEIIEIFASFSEFSEDPSKWTFETIWADINKINTSTKSTSKKRMKAGG